MSDSRPPAPKRASSPTAPRKSKTRDVPFPDDDDDNVVPLHRDGVLRASDFRMKVAKHLWHPYLPLGKITVFDGDPGLGKSQITIDLAARVISGTPMPQTGIRRTRQKRVPSRGVVMICAEDDWADTVLPRLVAALRSLGIEDQEAALSLVAVVGMKRDDKGQVQPLEFPRDAGRVREAIEAVSGVFVVVDPIMAFFGENTNTGSDASVRKALGPFKELAAETSAAFVLIRHLNKSVDLKAEYRGGGSHGGFIGLARSSWLVGEHPDDRGVFVFVHSKANITVKGASIQYVIVGRSVEDGDGKEIETSGIEWQESIDMDANTLLRGHDSRKDAPARDECWVDMSMLLDEQDPRPADLTEGLLKKAGHTAATIKATKKHYGVKSIRRFENGKVTGWDWTLGDAGDGEEIR